MIVQTIRRLPELGMLLLFVMVGLGLFALTDPVAVSPVVLMLAFFVLFGIFYFACRILLQLTGLRDKLSPGLYTGLLVGAAALPVLLLALQSLGQLTPRDTITLAVIYIIGYFYLSRTVPPRT